jgi:hypothetical protein
VLVENGGSQLVSFHETRRDAEKAAGMIARSLKYQLVLE